MIADVTKLKLPRADASASTLLYVVKVWERVKRFLDFRRRHRWKIKGVFLFIMHALGVLSSFDAVMNTRTSQGTIAWVVSLNTLPVVSVPLYWVFGANDFNDYIQDRRERDEKVRPMAEALISDEMREEVSAEANTDLTEALQSLTLLPLTKGNQVELLVDGKNTFESIFKDIAAAEDYVLVQFYIIRDDKLGGQLKDLLIRKAREGVRVYVLYDDYGSLDIGDSYVNEMRDAGVQVKSFLQLMGKANQFQLNFRNHRKIVVVDGKKGFVGGHNVGDEYLGMHPTLTPWRDSHLRLQGPIVTYLQIPFVEDWYWVTDELLNDLNWDAKEQLLSSQASGGEAEAICIPSGPSDSVQTANLMFQAAIQAAEKRIWLVSPYFVPDESFVHALQLAALRGVEIRILVPDVSDSVLVDYSTYSYVKDLEKLGIDIYRYESGFMHQKIMLVDDDFTLHGSANADNRSFRLNFEVMVGVFSKELAAATEEMLEKDFAGSRKMEEGVVEEKGWWFQLKVRGARLLAPIQ